MRASDKTLTSPGVAAQDHRVEHFEAPFRVCLRATMPLVENVMPNTFPAKELDDRRTPV